MKVVTAFLIALLISIDAGAQKTGPPCDRSITYTNRNQVDPRPLSIAMVLGRVVVTFEEHNAKHADLDPVSEACLGLFTEKDRRLVSVAAVDSEGNFQFGAVPPGLYRLVVRAGPLCVANIPLIITKGPGTKKRHSRIVVYMRPAGVDSCSYGDYQ